MYLVVVQFWPFLCHVTRCVTEGRGGVRPGQILLMKAGRNMYKMRRSANSNLLTLLLPYPLITTSTVYRWRDLVVYLFSMKDLKFCLASHPPILCPKKATQVNGFPVSAFVVYIFPSYLVTILLPW